MAGASRKKADGALLMALACGATVESAARKTGLGERTVYRRLADPAFQEQLASLRFETVQRSAAMLSAASLEAVKTLVSLQEASVPAPVRLGAARSILEFGSKLRETVELEQRLTALEQRISRPANDA
jgi:hypothetical protein